MIIEIYITESGLGCFFGTINLIKDWSRLTTFFHFVPDHFAFLVVIWKNDETNMAVFVEFSRSQNNEKKTTWDSIQTDHTD